MTLEQFQIERTKIISDMLDNPDKHGIFPTTKCFKELDKLFLEITSAPWISISDRLPEENEDAWPDNAIDVWVATKNGSVYLSQYSEDDFAFCDITHWMLAAKPLAPK